MKISSGRRLAERLVENLVKKSTLNRTLFGRRTVSSESAKQSIFVWRKPSIQLVRQCNTARTVSVLSANGWPCGKTIRPDNFTVAALHFKVCRALSRSLQRSVRLARNACRWSSHRTQWSPALAERPDLICH